jgi:hypothetical protein
MPRSLMVMVIWCRASGSEDQKSQLFRGLVGTGVPLDGVVEIGELERIAHKEHRRVVPHQVPVSLLGVELHRKSPDVPLGIGGAALAGHGGEAHEEVGFLADLREDLGLGVLGDVVGDREGAEGPGTFGVHAALGDHLPVEVGELLQVPDVLQQRRPAGTCGHDVLVVDDGGSRVGGKLLLLAHRSPPGFNGFRRGFLAALDLPEAVFFAQAAHNPRTSTCVAMTLPNFLTDEGIVSALRSALSKSFASPH